MKTDGKIHGRKPYDEHLPKFVHSQVIDEIKLSIENLIEQASLYPSVQDVVVFKATWLRENILSKFTEPSADTAKARREAAIAKWRLMDARNARTNMRLMFGECDFGPFTSHQLLNRARRFVTQIIGNCPQTRASHRSDTKLTACVDGMFSNGASTRVKRDLDAIAAKFVGKANTTEEAWPLFLHLVVAESPLWAREFTEGRLTPEFVPGSVMFTVPKNAEIDRVACKEPEVNMYMQKGVGDYIRSALKSKRGIDLNDQSANQRLAREGSKLGKLATLDLSSASDLISEELVRALLPQKWFDLLDAIRVKRTVIDGVEHELHMFSSMGNGFTFELESLLFYVITTAVCSLLGVSGSVSVYGDDIVVPSSAAGMLAKVLAFLGAKLNTKKSYWSGGFRESCGKHYFYGEDVTPFYVGKRIATLTDLMLVLNKYRKWSTHGDVALGFYPILQDTTFQCWEKLSRHVPEFLHGGKDVDVDSSLASLGNPKKRLTVAWKEYEFGEDGAYLHWSRGREFSKLEFSTSRGRREMHKYVSRNRVWDRMLPAGLCWECELSA